MLGCKAVVGKFLSQLQKIHPLWSSYEICLTKHWEKQTMLRVLPQCGLTFCETGFCHEILVATNLCLKWDSPLYLELRHKFLEDQTQDCSTQPSRTMHCFWECVGVTKTAWKLAWYLPGFLCHKDCCSTCWNCWAANFWCLSEVLAVCDFHWLILWVSVSVAPTITNSEIVQGHAVKVALKQDTR